MTEAQLRDRIGLFLVVAQFFILILILGLYSMGGFLFPEMTTTVALILPMFASYTTVITKYFAENRRRMNPRSRPVTGTFSFLTCLLPSLFVLLLIAIIVAWARRLAFESFDEFKITLGIVESAFGVYLGQLLYSLFKPK